MKDQFDGLIPVTLIVSLFCISLALIQNAKKDNQQKQHLFGKSIDGQFNCDFKTYKSNQNLFKIKYKVFSLLFFVFNWIVHTENL